MEGGFYMAEWWTVSAGKLDGKSTNATNERREKGQSRAQGGNIEPWENPKGRTIRETGQVDGGGIGDHHGQSLTTLPRLYVPKIN